MVDGDTAIQVGFGSRSWRSGVEVKLTTVEIASGGAA
jgi:hypothetical protein